MLTIY